jgi:hypothetical protein
MSNRRRTQWEAGGSFGDVVMELHKERHISDTQCAIAIRFLEDLRGAYGDSKGLVQQPQVRVQTSHKAALYPAGGAANEAQARMSAVLHKLRDSEREVLHFLIMKRELPRGTLSDLGRLHSNYKTAKTLRAAAVGLVRALLAAIVDVYPRPVPT